MMKAFVSLVAVVVLIACVWPDERQGADGGAVRPARPTRSSHLDRARVPPRSDGKRSHRYTWSDVNQRSFTLQGDVMRHDLRGSPPRLSLTVSLEASRVDAVVNAFGIAKARLQFPARGRSEEQVYRARRERERYFRSRGFERNEEGKLRVDYLWVLDKSRADLAPTMRALHRLAMKRQYETMRGLFGMVASFVQSLKYVIPPSERTLPNGQHVRTGGVNMPQEALVTGEGDCDTVSMLFSGLTANLKTAKVVLVVGQRGFKHAFVGVRGVPRRGDRYISVRGSRFILIELTNPFPLGALSNKSWKYVQRNMYRLVPMG